MTLKLKVGRFTIDVDNILVFLFFALTIIIFLIQRNTIFTSLRIAILAAGAVRGFYICAREKFYKPLLLAVFFVLCWMACFIFQASENSSFGIITFTVLYIGFSVLLLKEKIGIGRGVILLILCGGLIILRSIRITDMNDLLIGSSRNYISVLMLFALLFYYLALIKEKIKTILPFLLPAILYMIICLISYGRGGIITAAFLLFFICLYISIATKVKWRKRVFRVLMILSAAIFAFALAWNNQIIDSLSVYLWRFNYGVTDEARMSIWSTFFKNNALSIRNFVFGSDASLIRADRNLHNSFLQCYAYFGLIGFVGLIILFIRAILKGIKHNNLLWTTLILTLLLRASTDKLFFEGYCEVFLYYFLMYWDYTAHIKAQNGHQ